MLTEIKRLVKHSGIYFIGLASQAVVNFLLVPVYSRYLKAEGFGQFELISSFLQILIFLFTIGINAAVVKVYVRDAKTWQEKRKVIATAFYMTMPLTIVGGFVLFGWSAWWAKFLLGSKDFALLFKIVTGTFILSVFNSLGFAILRAKERSKQYTLVNVVKFSLFLLFNLWLLIAFKWGVTGVLSADLFVQIIAATIFLWFFYEPGGLSALANGVKQQTPRLRNFSKFYAKKLLYFGIPMIPSTVGMFIVGLSDRYFLRFMTDFTEVGIYSLGYKIGFVIFVVIVSPFQLAWPTFSFDLASKRPDHKKIFSKILTYFVLAAGLFGLILSMFAKELIYIIATPEFAPASIVVPLIALSYVLLGVHFVTVPGLHIKEKTKFYPIIILVPAVLNLLLNYFFIGWWQMMGAAIATLVAFIITAILTFYFSQKYYPIKYEYARLAKLVLLFGLAYSFSIGGTFWKFVGLAIVIFFIWRWILDAKETTKVRAILNNLVKILKNLNH